MPAAIQRFRDACRLAVTLLWLWIVAIQLLAADGAKKAWKPSTAGDEIFTNLTVFKIQIEIAPKDMNTLRGSSRTTGNAWEDQRFNVPCTVREGGKVYTNVAVHLKGAAGSFRPVDENPAVTLIFDKYVKGQTFHGLKKLSLNNSVQDPSFLRERLSRETFLRAGLPVPRAGFATLQLNDHYLGMRVLLEGLDKVFLKRHFSDPTGNLYDSGLARDISTDLTKISGENHADHSDLKLLLRAMDSQPNKLMAALDKVLDVDRFIRMVAMEIILCHWDGYALNRNNYRIYHDPEKNRFVFMPHGMDQAFGSHRSGPDLPLTPMYPKGILVEDIRSTPEGATRYLETAREMATNYFNVQYLTNRVNELGACVRQAIAEEDPARARRYDSQLSELREFIVERGDVLRRQITDLESVLRFDTNRTAYITGWKTRVDRGTPSFTVASGNEGVRTYEVTANGAASIFTRVRLMPGKYHFEGDLQLEKIVAEPKVPNAGVCLRMNWKEAASYLTGSTEGWVHYSHVFQIYDGPVEVELICSVRALSGKATFDARTLKLVRD